MALIDSLGSRPNIAIGERAQRAHDVSKKFPSGAVLIGQTPKEMWRRHILASKAASRLFGSQGPSSLNDVPASRGPSERPAEVQPHVSVDEDDRIAATQERSKDHQPSVSPATIGNVCMDVIEDLGSSSQRDSDDASLNLLEQSKCTTYGGPGVAKPTVNKSEHAFAYGTKLSPSPTFNENLDRGDNPMLASIRIQPDERHDRLEDMSIIHHGRINTVKHNVQAMSSGGVLESCKTDFNHDLLNVWPGSETSKVMTSSEKALQAAQNDANDGQEVEQRLAPNNGKGRARSFLEERVLQRNGKAKATDNEMEGATR